MKLKWPMKTAAAAALAAALVIAPTIGASAAQIGWDYYCSDRFALKSYAVTSVTHYHNGGPVASWTNSVSTWRATYHPGGSGNGSIWASYAIYNSDHYCYINA